MGDRKANEMVERAVQAISEQVRVLKTGLEEKIQMNSREASNYWLVGGALCTDLMNTYQCGKDWRTA